MAACRRQPRFKAVQAGGQQAVEAVAVPSVPSAMASGEASAPSSDRALHSFDSRLVLPVVWGAWDGKRAVRVEASKLAILLASCFQWGLQLASRGTSAELVELSKGILDGQVIQ